MVWRHRRSGTEKVLGSLPEQQQREMVALFPLGRMGTPEDVALAALFLASESASWLTGVTLDVTGGPCDGLKSRIVPGPTGLRLGVSGDHRCGIGRRAVVVEGPTKRLGHFTAVDGLSFAVDRWSASAPWLLPRDRARHPAVLPLPMQGAAGAE